MYIYKSNLILMWEYRSSEYGLVTWPKLLKKFSSLSHIFTRTTYLKKSMVDCEVLEIFLSWPFYKDTLS